jgi:molecular chaperone Hsp33
MTEPSPDRSGNVEASLPSDDLVLAFQTISSGVTGRIVRLGDSVNDVLTRHNYPEAVSRVLGEALALTAMLGSQLKFDGRLILQTSSDGPLGFMVVNYETTGTLRGYANFDKDRIAALSSDGAASDDAAVLGKGHLALTIDPGGDMERYQGVVALDGGTLSDAAHVYFRQSEQLPTFVKLAVARHFAHGTWRWRAGGLMVQHLTGQGGVDIPERDDGEESGWVLGTDDDNWRRVEILARTAQDHELLDPLLTPERLLYRLFHEEGVRTAPPQAIAMKCRCSRENVEVFLKSFGMEKLADMRDADGAVTVTCEFCATPYRFTEVDLTE